MAWFLLAVGPVSAVIAVLVVYLMSHHHAVVRRFPGGGFGLFGP
ncbi:hypothetical protein [Actinokineospora globicatena]|nr:hypothetical protein [Actinokineospora globicatena]MCP2306266.1 hypothetical protein [Actinokineospora globicatena]